MTDSGAGDPRLVPPPEANPSAPMLDAQQRPGQRWNGLLVRVLARQHIRAVYQPIINLNDAVIHGYEALARPTTVPDDGNVTEFFTTAEQLGIGRDLDWLCRRAAVTSSIKHLNGAKLFLNLNASTLIDTEMDASLMLQMASTAGMQSSDIVLEITNRALTMGAVRLPVVSAIYHHYGMCVALADFDEEHEPFDVIANCRIDYIKLARSVAATLDEGGGALVEATLAYAKENNVTVVAEGIEREDQAKRLQSMGVTLGQGFFYGRPAPLDPSEVVETPSTDVVG